MVYLFNNQVTLAATPQVDAFGRLRVGQPMTLFDSQQRFGLDKSFTSNVASGGSISFVTNQSSANLTVTNTLNSFAARESKYVLKYQPAKSQAAFMTFVMNPISSGNLQQRVGYFGASNGYYVELTDQLYLVQRSNVTGTVSNTRVPQSSWNADTLIYPGSGSSGYNLDITKAQIFWLDIEWLGVGDVRCGFVLNGQKVVAHTFKHANVSSTAYITTACLPVRYEIQSLTASGPATSNLTQVCCSVQSEGGYTEPFTFFSNISTFSFASGTVGTWTPICSIQLSPTRLESIAVIQQVDFVITSTDTVQWALWSNVSLSNLGGTPNFITPPNNGSVQIDKAATTFNITNCWQVASTLMTNSGGNSVSTTKVDLASYFSQIGRDSFAGVSEIFTLAVYRPAGTGSLTGYALLSWQEML